MYACAHGGSSWTGWGVGVGCVLHLHSIHVVAFPSTLTAFLAHRQVRQARPCGVMITQSGMVPLGSILRRYDRCDSSASATGDTSSSPARKVCWTRLGRAAPVRVYILAAGFGGAVALMWAAAAAPTAGDGCSTTVGGRDAAIGDGTWALGPCRVGLRIATAAGAGLSDHSRCRISCQPARGCGRMVQWAVPGIGGIQHQSSPVDTSESPVR